MRRRYRHPGPIARDDFSVEEHGHESPCWIWAHSLWPDGYPALNVTPGKRGMAHRAMYEQTHDLCLLPSTVLHHRCHVRACVRPEHLEPMTQSEHMRHHSALRYPADPPPLRPPLMLIPAALEALAETRKLRARLPMA